MKPILSALLILALMGCATGSEVELDIPDTPLQEDTEERAATPVPLPPLVYVAPLEVGGNFWENPRSEKELKLYRVPSIQRSKVTKKWISWAFHISDPSITNEIFKSIRSSKSPCACPYFVSAKSQRCAKNSTYDPKDSKKLCYPIDVAKARMDQESKVTRNN